MFSGSIVWMFPAHCYVALSSENLHFFMLDFHRPIFVLGLFYGIAIHTMVVMNEPRMTLNVCLIVCLKHNSDVQFMSTILCVEEILSMVQQKGRSRLELCRCGI